MDRDLQSIIADLAHANIVLRRAEADMTEKSRKYDRVVATAERHKMNMEDDINDAIREYSDASNRYNVCLASFQDLTLRMMNRQKAVIAEKYGH
jgi:hypothetical protein